MSQPFRITGKHVLFGMVTFFAAIIAVNAVFIFFAVRSFPGEQEEKSYMQGLNYNERLEERATQASLGWSVEITKADRQEAGFILEVVFTDKTGKSLEGLTIDGIVSRPADNNDDHAIAFMHLGKGRYQAVVPVTNVGVWKLAASAVNGNGERFEFETKLFLE